MDKNNAFHIVHQEFNFLNSYLPTQKKDHFLDMQVTYVKFGGMFLNAK